MGKGRMRRPFRLKGGRTTTKIRNDHKEYARIADFETGKDTDEAENTLLTASVTAE